MMPLLLRLTLLPRRWWHLAYPRSWVLRLAVEALEVLAQLVEVEVAVVPPHLLVDCFGDQMLKLGYGIFVQMLLAADRSALVARLACQMFLHVRRTGDPSSLCAGSWICAVRRWQHVAPRC